VSETLVDFLVDLASEPDRLKAFLSNPTHIVDQSRLSESDKAAILSRDSRTVLKALGLAAGKTVMQMFSGGPKVTRDKPPSTLTSKKTGNKKTGTMKK
jgi:hypothetical protein